MIQSIRHSDELLEVFIPEPDFKIIWASDVHLDSKFSMWNNLKKYLNDNPKSYLVMGGDSLDVMQFVKDYRASRDAMQDKFNGDNYANRVINYVREQVVEPYKDRILCWNRGNHDNSIIKHHNIDLLGLICGADVNIHEFSGYLQINSVCNNIKSNNLIHFSHSPESGGVRSKGALSVDIAKSEYPSADIWIREHIHNGFIHPVRHELVRKDKRVVYQKNKWYIQNIAVKQESQGKRNGFHYETNKGNRASGFVELEFKFNKTKAKTYCSQCHHVVF